MWKAMRRVHPAPFFQYTVEWSRASCTGTVSARFDGPGRAADRAAVTLCACTHARARAGFKQVTWAYLARSALCNLIFIFACTLQYHHATITPPLPLALCASRHTGNCGSGPGGGGRAGGGGPPTPLPIETLPPRQPTPYPPTPNRVSHPYPTSQKTQILAMGL